MQFAYQLAPRGEQTKYEEKTIDGVVYIPKYSVEVSKMYPFSDQLISKQAYADYFWRIVTYIILFHLLCFSVPEMRGYFSVLFVLWCGFLLDYYLCYNEQFYERDFGLFLLRVSYSLIAGLVMLGLLLYDILRKW